jgi:hypothetical protein
VSDRWTHHLSAYLDGDLAEPRRRELEAHLAGCADCRAVLVELREVVNQARALTDAPPAEDLWPAIAARIRTARDPAVASSTEAPFTARPAAIRRGLLDWLGRRLTFTVPQAVAAAAALIIVAAAAVWLALGPGPMGRRSPAEGGSTAVSGPERGAGLAAGEGSLPISAASATTALADQRYDATIAELQRILAQDRGRLDSTTVRVIEKNLAIIDQALAEARRAVEADPSNFYLRNHLAGVMKRKADLLRQATLIASAQG